MYESARGTHTRGVLQHDVDQVATRGQFLSNIKYDTRARSSPCLVELGKLGEIELLVARDALAAAVCLHGRVKKYQSFNQSTHTETEY